MHIVIAGGTGLLGRALARAALAAGHRITILSRRPRHPHAVHWPAAEGDRAWWRVVDGCDAVVNLAGAPIAERRWTAARKEEIRRSRIDSTRAIVAAIRAVERPPAVLLNASAIGIYGPRGDEAVTEETPPGRDFLADVCQEWERAALEAAAPRPGSAHGTRVVLLRTGLVLDRHGGALPRLALPFRFCAGGPLGSGQQYMSWIHRDDWTALVMSAMLAPGLAGAINLTAPSPVRNAEMARTLGRVLRRPSFVRTPAFALRLALGEMADAMILTGQRVLPARAQAHGFAFRFPELEAALRDLYSE
ncbi:MAG TPA: TIGR01777 family oxidoreductase [Vicinamibacterales bacterium]|nr:TIGR01777 family oxidoreductase [Vicinamibacterales bacterium]